MIYFLANCPTMVTEYESLTNACGPFFWDIREKDAIEDEAISALRSKEHFRRIVDSQNVFPEILFIYHLMQAFQKVVRDDLKSAVESLNSAEKTLADVKQKATLENVENVLQHMFIETKSHILLKQGRQAEMVELLEQIVDVEDMNKTELAMLHGCHCSALLLHSLENEEGIEYARKAIEYEPDNGKWHFLLAQNKREQRRKPFAPLLRPDMEEDSAFTKAYRLCPNDLFGMAVARCYRESLKYPKANRIYKKVYDNKPTSCTIQLQLALGFMRNPKGKETAKKCLDFVAEMMPDSVKYTHYMAIYEEKCNGDLKAALSYYRSSTEKFNNAAEVQYMQCWKRVDINWDPLPYLLNLSQKYRNFASYVTQPIYIHIGSYYLFNMCDVLSASPYLTKAIKMNPNDKQLKNYTLLFGSKDSKNIYHELAHEVVHALENDTAIYDKEEIGILNDTLQLCRENCKDLPLRLRSSTTQARTSNTTNGCRNESRGSPWHVKNTNWREEELSTGLRGSDSRSSGDVLNSPNRDLGSSYETNYTSWRSEGRVTQGTLSNPRPSRPFCDEQNIEVANHTEDEGWILHSTKKMKAKQKRHVL